MKKIKLTPAKVDDWRTVYHCTRNADVEHLIAVSNEVRISTDVDAYIVGNPNNVYPDMWRGIVEISKAQALSWLRCSIDDKWAFKNDDLVLRCYVVERVEKNRYQRGTYKPLPDRTVRVLYIG